MHQNNVKYLSGGHYCFFAIRLRSNFENINSQFNIACFIEKRITLRVSIAACKPCGLREPLVPWEFHPVKQEQT